MKPFNLEQALQGKPVVLKNGAKAYVLCNVKDKFDSVDNDESYPLKGVRSYDTDSERFFETVSWTLTGDYQANYKDKLDIVGMWEDNEKQTLEKAYKKKLPVCQNKVLEEGEQEKRYLVHLKTDDDEYILVDIEGNFYLASKFKYVFKLADEETEENMLEVKLPKPVSYVEVGKRYYFIKKYNSGDIAIELSNPILEPRKTSNTDKYFSSKKQAKKWLKFIKQAI